MNRPPPDPQRLSQIDRRAAIGLGVAAVATAMTSTAEAASLDVGKPEDAAQIHRKLQFRTDSGLVFWWIRGPSFGQIGAELTPLYEMNFGVVQRVLQRADGGFDVTSLEMAFRTDLATGRPLQSLHNPYTGESVPIEFTPVGPTKVSYSRDNVPSVPTELGGSKLQFEAIHALPFVVGDTVYYRHRARTRVVTPGAADRIINDLSTFSGPARQALDPRVTWVDAKLQSSDVTGWPRWMKMGDRPGGATLRGVGGKVRRFADMPSDWLAMLQQARPDIAADPVGALDRPQATYKN
jgi:Protein of unknown function (DUF1838)